MKTATCHPDRQHYANGNCVPCYHAKRRQSKGGTRRGERITTPTCHADRVAYFRGLCRPCYDKRWRKANLERARAGVNTANRKRKHSPSIGLSVERAKVCADIMSDLGRVYAADFNSECNKADYTVAA